MRVPGVYGRLCGKKLNPRLQTIYDTELPLVDCSEAFLGQESTLIDPSTPWWMEIGFGDGIHLRTQLQRNPHVHFLGVEVFRPGIAQCLKDLSQNARNQLHIFPHNVHLLMPRLPKTVIEKIFILFPDPWPKYRHHKRRLLQPEFLSQCWKVLKDEGKLIIASDVIPLIHWMQNNLLEHQGFQYVEGAYSSDPLEWPAWPCDLTLSTYGRKAVHKTYFIWKKCLKQMHV
ncbi:tRNA (guanosine(46)-N7)-methyltransferase TrmB [Holospora curviuscula]|uniref:tRNA (guanine-N(7)-)-methyltransferase n=1 Tax=Holospora curviuscula TaxID=1082868 RepID=A0A2S5RE84_9PROT|nr:tRNA (guanosine(46)-N7)-methyltransferase TrmB [Holospora curviuscula]PPE05620.1 tRNA (guanine-N(7)-)-methyltransferase [Holospora curviuscula]